MSRIRLKNLVLLAFTLLLLACVVEFVLRICGDMYLKRLYVQMRPSKMASADSVNIICLGESSTAGLWVKPEESYPSQLQAMLKLYYPAKAINVYVPPHVGQNTSQIRNRIEQYIRIYEPRLIIIMAGYNNEWSLAESNIMSFIHLNNYESFKLKMSIYLDNLRLFRLMRFVYYRYFFNKQAVYYTHKVGNFEISRYMWGGPELVVLAPEQAKEIRYFATSNKQAFIKLWRDDIERIISAARKHNVNVLLATYHINPSYLSAEEFVAMSKREGVWLVRNDIIFQNILADKSAREYLLQDNWHPNKKGYRIIAENTFNEIISKRLIAP